MGAWPLRVLSLTGLGVAIGASNNTPLRSKCSRYVPNSSPTQISPLASITKDSGSKSAPVSSRFAEDLLTISKGISLLGSESWMKLWTETLRSPFSVPAKLGLIWYKRKRKSALLPFAPKPLSARNQNTEPSPPGANWTPLKPWTGWPENGVVRPLVGLVTAAPDFGPSEKVSAGREAKPFNVTIGTSLSVMLAVTLPIASPL